MSFYPTAYATTAGRGLDNVKLVGALRNALLRSNFALVNNPIPGIDMPIPADGCVPTIVTTLTVEENDIPMFSHPIYIDLSDIRKSSVENYMVSDARPFMSAKPLDREGRLVAKNKTEFDFTKNRTLLSSHWYKENFEDFKSLGNCLTAIYSSWISEAISRIYGLDTKDQQLIAVAAAYLFQSLFTKQHKFDEHDRVRFASIISRTTYMEMSEVISILENYPTMGSLEDFCVMVKQITENPRVEDLTPALVLSTIASSWYGTNGREIAAVSTEHVPTFVMMIYASFTERSYRNSNLAKIAERFRGRKGEEQFIRSLKSLIEEIKIY